MREIQRARRACVAASRKKVGRKRRLLPTTSSRHQSVFKASFPNRIMRRNLMTGEGVDASSMSDYMLNKIQKEMLKAIAIPPDIENFTTKNEETLIQSIDKKIIF